MSYEQGHVKRDPATGAVAIRTIFPEDAGITSQAWLLATANRGAVFLRTSDLEAWDDLYVPDPDDLPDPYASPTPGTPVVEE